MIVHLRTYVENLYSMSARQRRGDPRTHHEKSLSFVSLSLSVRFIYTANGIALTFSQFRHGTVPYVVYLLTLYLNLCHKQLHVC